MRPHLTIFLFLVIAIYSCKNKPKEAIEYPSKGSIFLFDTASGKNIVSSDDKKLISTWETFRDAMSKSDYKAMKSLSLDSIICFCGDVDDNNDIKAVDTFYNKYSPKLFSDDFVSIAFDSSKVWSRYDWDSMYYYAYPFLTTISDLEYPKIVEINFSFPIPKGEEEGTLGTLAFIETKNSYKLLGYFTIP